MNVRRCLLVLPDGAVNRNMGSGQRSALIFEAMKQVAPTDVVVLGETPGGDLFAPDPALKAAFFPGAASLHRVRSRHFHIRRKRGLAWLMFNLDRFLRIGRFYKPEKSVREGLARIMRPEHDIVAFRYVHPFCLCGIEATPTRRIFVDIDDRDDQKFASAARATLGRGVATWFLDAAVLPRLRRILRVRLSRASLLWYAAEEDILPLRTIQASVLRNVPFITAEGRLPPATASRDMLFVGTFSHRPNQDGVRWFLQNCWAEVLRRHPHSRFRIVGMGDWPALAAEFPDLEGVDFVGTVEDVAAEYARSRIAISPVFDGGGSKIKVIETCAFGRLPIVSSHSARGFGTTISASLPQADTPEGFIDLCDLYLADDAGLMGEIAKLQKLQQAQFSRASAEDQIRTDILGQPG